MAKRKATRKKTATSSIKKAKTSTRTQKQTKKTRNTTAPRSTVNKTKTRRKKAPSHKKSATKKSTANESKKKQAVRTGAARKKVAPKATVTKPAVLEKTVKKDVSKKASKKRTAKKKVVRRRFIRRRHAGPEEPGLPFKEIRARLGLIGPQIAALRWLDGLYLYGAALLEKPRLERVDFIVIYRGLRSAARLKSAEAELRELIAAVLPVEFDLNTGSPGIGRLLNEGNPAAQAHLGYSEPVFTRDA